MSEQRDGEDMTTDAHGLPVRFVNQVEAGKAEEAETFKECYLMMADQAEEVYQKATDPKVKLMALDIKRKLHKDAERANGTACKHRDRSTGHVDAA